MLVDSMINFIIEFLSHYLKSQCFLGIITTSTFFYIGWGSLALRAYRVKGVFDTYDDYLKALSSKDHVKKGGENKN